MRMRRALLVLAVATGGTLVSLLIGLVANSVPGGARWPGWLEVLRRHPWPSMLVLLVPASLFAFLGLMPEREKHPDGSADDRRLATVADRLATTIGGQLALEAERQKLNDPYAMPVRWRPADPALVARWSALVRLATTGPGWPSAANRQTWAPDAGGLAGTDNELVEVLDRVPTGRLAVLGEPGSGKTILLLRLALDVLERRCPGDSVPILLPMTSWNPLAEGLFSWIEHWLTLNDSDLDAASPDRSGMSTARALLESGLIMPILDGLDEMPGPVGGAAIAQINRAIRPGQRMVLAARTEDFRTAVRSSGVQVQLTGAAAVELLPLDITVVADYLRDSAGGGPEAAARWDGVLSALVANASAPLALAFTTPLMATLARAIYNPRPEERLTDIPRQPVELLNAELFATRIAVEQHLFDWFIPAVYRSHPGQPDDPWSAPQAARWLEFVADDLEDRLHGMTDFAWWRLEGAAPRHLVGASVGILGFLAGTLGAPYAGLGIGLIAAFLVGLPVRERSRRDRPGSVARLAHGFAGGILGGETGALVALGVFGAGPGNSRLSAFITAGLAFGFAVTPLSSFAAALVGGFAGVVTTACYEHAAVFTDIRAAIGIGAHLINGIGYGLGASVAVSILHRRTPAHGLRWSPRGVAGGVACGLALGFAAWIQIGRSGGLVIGFVAMIGAGGGGGGVWRAGLRSDSRRGSRSGGPGDL